MLRKRAEIATKILMELGDEDRKMRTVDLGAALGYSDSHLESIISDLKHSGLIKGKRGPAGGMWRLFPLSEITVAMVFKAVIDGLSEFDYSIMPTMEKLDLQKLKEVIASKGKRNGR